MEVFEHAEWASTDTTAYHHRQRDEEVDLVLESRAGDIVAIEVKSAASLRPSDWRPMERPGRLAGSTFGPEWSSAPARRRSHWEIAFGRLP